jgi:type IV fimbrial biogenesis protein FimT
MKVCSRAHRTLGLGLSLLELLVVLGLVGVLASLAVPSMGALLLNRSVHSQAEALVADLRLARSEAVKRAHTVVMCSSLDGQACSASAAWLEGWIVFADRDGDRLMDASEELIRVQPRLSGLISVASTKPQNDNAYFVYHPTGWAKAANQTLVFTPQGSAAAPRVVCISGQGRPTLRPEGWSECR